FMLIRRVMAFVVRAIDYEDPGPKKSRNAESTDCEAFRFGCGGGWPLGPALLGCETCDRAPAILLSSALSCVFSASSLALRFCDVSKSLRRFSPHTAIALTRAIALGP